MPLPLYFFINESGFLSYISPLCITYCGLVFIADATGSQLKKIRKIVSEMSGKGTEEVRVVVSPYRICPLGAHVDHQVSRLHLYFL